MGTFKKWLAHRVLKMGKWELDEQFKGFKGSCVMIGVPHTSNWDFVYAIAAFTAMGFPVRFTIKKEWMRFPFKGLMLSFGAIPIDRTPKKPGDPRPSMVDAMIELFKEHDNLVVLITPEGTRKRMEKWRTGFYHVAKGAGVPIGLGYLDYEKRTAGVGMFVQPGDDMHKDMCEIMKFYSTIKGRFPEKFSIDMNYADLVKEV
jgi:1-acyl-sn-glycerol-3-phosphate acyltransferase